MQTKTKVGGAAGGLAALMALGAAVVAFIVFLMVVLVALAAVASAVVAYLKRDAWTLPAYRWARDKGSRVSSPAYNWVRDKSGRWNRTPWATGNGAGPESAAPADKVAD
jgi:phage shock protein PspC (stress-responsive transcriptional regulator)